MRSSLLVLSRNDLPLAIVYWLIEICNVVSFGGLVRLAVVKRIIIQIIQILERVEKTVIVIYNCISYAFLLCTNNVACATNYCDGW